MGRNGSPEGNRAFTLIELLVVIAVIAILAGILFPVFSSAREKARQTTCLSNFRQINTAVLMYTQDYDETYPFLRTPGVANVQTLYWSNLVFPYIKNYSVFSCPNDRIATDPTFLGRIGRLGHASEMQLVFPDFGYNYRAFSPFVENVDFIPSTLSAINQPSRTVLGVESNAAGNRSPVSLSPGSNYVESPPHGWIGTEETGWYGFVIFRHQKMASCAFADGHIKAQGYGSLTRGYDAASRTITNTNDYLWDTE